MRLVMLHLVHADDGIELQRAGGTVERELRVREGTAGEDGEIEVLGESFEHSGTGDPMLAQDQPVGAVAEEDGLEVVFHGLEGDVEADAVHDVVGEFPIVVPAALILEILNLFARGGDAGEVFHRFRDGLAVAFGDVYQDAIHVEDDERFHAWFQMSVRAATRRRVCSRVPTVMRTHPAAS